MKRFFVAVFLLVSMVLLAACGSSDSSNSEAKASGDKNAFPNKTINLIIPWSAGGGTDTGARILVPYVEKELGVTVNVINKPGGGGWIGWSELANSKPDGYTIGYINSPHLMTGYLNPEFKRNNSLDSFSYIANHVIDPDVIAIQADEDRFSTIEELIEFAKDNELTATATGVGTDEHLVMMDFNMNYGTKFQPVHFKGSAESQTAVLGGHADILIANAGEIMNLHKEGQVKIIGIASEERSKFLPDVPTLTESGFDVFLTSARGIAAPKDVDAEVLKVLRDAFEKAINNEEQMKKLEDVGYENHYLNSDDYLKLLQNDEARIKEVGKSLGW